MFFCCLRNEGMEQTHSRLHLTSGIHWSGISARLTLFWWWSGRRGRALGWLLIGSNRNRVVIGCCLQVVHTFPACLCWRPWRRVLWRILDAFCNRLSDLLIWKDGLPVLTSDGRLQSKSEIRKARSGQTLPCPFRNHKVMSQLTKRLPCCLQCCFLAHVHT